MPYPTFAPIRNSLFYRLAMVWAWAACGGHHLLGAEPPASTRPPASPTAAVVTSNPWVRSVFVTDDRQGRDPFFPESARRFQPVGPRVEQPDLSPFLEQLALKGITGAKNRRFAIINNEVFAVGEEHELPLSGRRIRLRCDEINADSVVVSVVGQPVKKELKMRRF